MQEESDVTTPSLRIAQRRRPVVLPVQMATKFELVINRKTAEALGLTTTPALASRADKLIE
jgi:putative tryptophan/tyrosine transport system substrate-binding protein